MGDFTKNQRRAIYAEAHDILEGCEFVDGRTFQDARYACYAVGMAADKILNGTEYPQGFCIGVVSLRKFEGWVTRDNFPEFFSFRDTDVYEVWLSFDPETGAKDINMTAETRAGNELRQTVLLLCHEMCN